MIRLAISESLAPLSLLAEGCVSVLVRPKGPESQVSTGSGQRHVPAAHLPHLGDDDASGMCLTPSRPPLRPRDQPGCQTAQSGLQQV